MSRRLLIHVGTPKTGTSLLQHALFTAREPLAEAGVLYPADRPDAHFLAALDLMGLRWGGLEDEAVGAWDRLVAQVREWEGTAIVSHEVLGAATREQAARALAELAGDDTEVDLVLSARDLARQVPAEWQENLKHRRTTTYADFLTALRDPAHPTRVSRWFWQVQDLPDVLDRWGGALPPERVHVVTVPRPGADPTALWDRFVEAFELGGLGLAPGERANASLGVPESAMLRRLNLRLNGDVAIAEEAEHDSASGGLASAHYRPLVRETVVHQHLAGHPDSPRLVLPPDLHAWVAALADDWVGVLAARGYDVVGDLDDLRVGDPASYADPDAPDTAAVAEAALDALAVMTREAARLREVEAHLAAEVADQRAQLDRFYGTRGYRAKQRLVGMAQTNPVAKGSYAAYRAVRRRD